MSEIIFHGILLNDEGTLTASAEGHPSDVIEAFHSVARILLESRGPWRITKVEGVCADDEIHDSKMQWVLIAKTKSQKNHTL